MIHTETLQVSGVRCERCVMRLAAALTGHEGLEAYLETKTVWTGL